MLWNPVTKIRETYTTRNNHSTCVHVKPSLIALLQTIVLLVRNFARHELQLHLNGSARKQSDSLIATNDIIAKVLCWDRLALEVWSDPREANGIKPGLTFVGQLRLETAKLEGILATLLHDPASKGLIGWEALGDIAIAVNTLVLDELLEAPLPSDWRLCNLPLESDSFEFHLTLLGHARPLLGTLGTHSRGLEVGL